jgi:hypothetical protein
LTFAEGGLAQVRLFATPKSGRTTQPVQQSGQVWTITIPYRREFQTYPATGIYMPHLGGSPDLSFLDQKFNLGLFTHNPWLSRLDKQTSQAQIQNSRGVVTSTTAPEHTHAIWRLDS